MSNKEIMKIFGGLFFLASCSLCFAKTAPNVNFYIRNNNMAPIYLSYKSCDHGKSWDHPNSFAILPNKEVKVDTISSNNDASVGPQCNYEISIPQYNVTYKFTVKQADHDAFFNCKWEGDNPNVSDEEWNDSNWGNKNRTMTYCSANDAQTAGECAQKAKHDCYYGNFGCPGAKAFSAVTITIQ